MIIQPLHISPSLAPYIAHALYVKKSDAEVSLFNLVPRFFGLWAFTLEETDEMSIDFDNGTKHTIAPCKIYSGGSGYVPVEFKISGRTEWILVMPRPHCTALFWKEDADHFANTMYCVSDMGQQLRILNEQVNTTRNIDFKWNYIQRYLEKKLSKPANNLNYVNSAISLMFNHSGVITMDSVAKYSCTCDRNLRDSFKQHIGYSPKKFASMIRFNAFIKQFLNQPKSKTLFETSVAFNYYDLSHLNKDFMRFMGISTDKFLSQEQGMNRLILC